MRGSRKRERMEGVGLRRRRVLLTWWVSRRRPSWAVAVSPPPLPPLPPPPPPPPLPPVRSPLPPAASSHSLYSPSRPKDILVSPCRVTFGLRAQPNLPARRTPWATLFDQPRQRAARVPGAACRHGDRTLAQPPRPNADSYPSALRYPLPSLPRLAFALPVLSSPEKESFDILVRASLRQIDGPRPLSALSSLFLSPASASPCRLFPSFLVPSSNR